MKTYQSIYPSEPLLRSQDSVRPRAAELMNVEYFEAEPASMPTAVFEQHHLLFNLRAKPHRVENWRNGEHRDFILRQHEVVITPSGVESGWCWHEQSQCIVITIDPTKLASFTETELSTVLATEQLQNIAQREDAELTSAASQLVDAMRSRSTGSEVMYESLARVFLVKLIQAYGAERTEKVELVPGFTAKQYKRVLDYLSHNFSKPITVEDISREAGLSTTHFTRLFKAVMGDTPYQYLMRYRVEQSQKMLADPSKPLIDISHACGFADQAHFSRTFKKYTQITPRAFRKQQ